MRRWSPSSKSHRTDSWPPCMRTMQALAPVSTEGQAGRIPIPGEPQSDVPWCDQFSLSLLAEPPKSGVKEKRKKAASFQTVSQLHKVRSRRGPSSPGPPQAALRSLLPAVPCLGWAAVKTCSDV